MHVTAKSVVSILTQFRFPVSGELKEQHWIRLWLLSSQPGPSSNSADRDEDSDHNQSGVLLLYRTFRYNKLHNKNKCLWLQCLGEKDPGPHGRRIHHATSFRGATDSFRGCPCPQRPVCGQTGSGQNRANRSRNSVCCVAVLRPERIGTTSEPTTGEGRNQN